MSDSVKNSPKSLDEVQEIVAPMIEAARKHYDENIGPAREKATKLYNADIEEQPAEEGYSSVIIPVVKDSIRKVMPTLMRIFTGPERYLQFSPRATVSGDQNVLLRREKTARAMTLYVNHIVMQENKGYRVLYGAFKDALTRRLGWLKWWVEQVDDPETAEFTGLNEQGLLALLIDRSVKIEREDIREYLSPEGGVLYDVVVERAGPRLKFRFDVVPGEELFWNQDATSVDDATILAHQRERRLHEIVAEGYDEEKVLELSGGANDDVPTDSTSERDARRPDAGGSQRNDSTRDADPAVRPILYTEAYVRLRYEGELGGRKVKDKKVRLYRVCTVGKAHRVLSMKPVSHRPFACLTPDFEPATLEGRGFADDLETAQKVQSEIHRGVLDSAAVALDSPIVYFDGHVSVADLLRPVRERIVRADVPADQAVQRMDHRFLGPDLLPLADYWERIVESTTGHTRASDGLDADVLQSTTKSAVTATVTAAQARTELIARSFAEGLKDAMYGLLRTVIEHQDYAAMVRVGGELVEIDPRAWDADMDVVVNVALGTGVTEDRMAFLQGIIADQSAVYMAGGPSNPLVKLSHMFNSRARALEMMGYANAEEFYGRVDPEMEQQLAQQPQQPQDPNAALAAAETEKAKIAAEVERYKADLDAQLRQAELGLRQAEAAAQNELAQVKLANEIALKMAEMEAKNGVALDREELKAKVALIKAELESQTRVTTAKIAAEASLAGHQAGLMKQSMSADAQERGHEVGLEKTRIQAAAARKRKEASDGGKD